MERGGRQPQKILIRLHFAQFQKPSAEKSLILKVLPEWPRIKELKIDNAIPMCTIGYECLLPAGLLYGLGNVAQMQEQTQRDRCARHKERQVLRKTHR